MTTRYKALLKLIIVPDDLNSAATSGIAARMVVEEMGAKKPHMESTHVIITFLWFILRCVILNMTASRTVKLMMGDMSLLAYQLWDIWFCLSLLRIDFSL